MAKRSTTDTCSLTLPLVIEKWQSDRLEKRFEIARQIYNTLLNYELKKLRRLEKSEDYQAITAEKKRIIAEKGLRDEEGNKTPEIESLNKKLQAMREKAGITDNDFNKDMKFFYKHFNKNVASGVAVHGIAPRVWDAFNDYFKGKGKKIHFKKRGTMNSVAGGSKTGKSCGTEIIYRDGVVKWKDLRLRVKFDPGNKYEEEMLKYRVKFCRILRKPGKNKTRWYVQLSLEGKPVIKCDKETGEVIHPVGSGAVGIDIGPQTIAYVSEKEADLLELADEVKNIEREKRIIQRKMDRSRRASNPDNYAEDGTIKRGVKLTWKKSKRYLKYQHELASLLRKQADTRKRQHTELANHLLSLGDTFYVEDMNWPSLTHRAKKTEISEKTGRYKRKKRFGKSVGNKAPATLIRILDLKLKSRGMEGVIKDSLSVKASQYNHITQKYTEKELSQRWNDMPDGRRIQRDLYSAFLLMHTNEEKTGFEQPALERDYERFVIMHDEVIKKLCSARRTVASMGIVRTAS
ncbi:MAG: transposase [Oscillospiraceae bacterium]|nr:transposase [Oscillospiraceae bacterium]